MDQLYMTSQVLNITRKTRSKKTKKKNTEYKENKIAHFSLKNNHLTTTIIDNFVGHIKLLKLVTEEYRCTQSIQRCHLLYLIIYLLQLKVSNFKEKRVPL